MMMMNQFIIRDFCVKKIKENIEVSDEFSGVCEQFEFNISQYMNMNVMLCFKIKIHPIN